MKKLVLLFCWFPVLSYSQDVPRSDLAEIISSVQTITIPKTTSRSSFDTLYSKHVKDLIFGTPQPGCDEVVIYSDGASGYAAGTNKFGDIEKLQKFKATNIIGVYQTLGVFAKKVVANPNTPIYSNLYKVDPVTHGPGEFLFSTDPILMSQIWGSLTNPSFTAFLFPATIPVSDSFFVSFTIPHNTGDTIVCATTKSGCYPGYQIAWERRADSTFKPFNDGTANTWGLNLELFICPVVEIGNTGGVHNPAKMNGISIYSVYPNPANEIVNIKFGIEEAGEVSLLLYDLTGHLIVQNKLGNLGAGIYSNSIPLTGVSKGTYNYAIRCNDRYFFSRISVQ